LLACVLTAATVGSVRAGDAPAAAAAPSPQFATVCVNEWLPEQYQCTRTSYRTECRTEAYTAFRCECVPEVRQRVCTVYRMVPEVKEVCRKVCVSVPYCEERTVMQTVCVCKPVTKIVRKCVDKGHWECVEVPCKPKRKWFGHKHDDCCDPCCPPPTKTVRVWVPCKVWEEYPVTSIEKVKECRPVVVKVTCYRQEWREEKCTVTCCKCVPEQKVENYTVLCKKLVPYQAYRTVKVCVPCTESVTCTRLVCRTVQKQVPIDTCCAAPCCETVCCKPCGKKKHARHSCADDCGCCH
jgi:hypothetical protein